MLSIFDNYEIVLGHLRNQRDGLDRLITWLEEIKAWNARNSFVTVPTGAAPNGAVGPGTYRIISAGENQPMPPPLLPPMPPDQDRAIIYAKGSDVIHDTSCKCGACESYNEAVRADRSL